METLTYRFDGTTAVRFPTEAVLVGVLASGNLEVLRNRPRWTAPWRSTSSPLPRASAPSGPR